MRIREATRKDKEDAIKIARELKEWFNKEGLRNMKIDFNLNNIIVCIEKNKVVGFLCYSSYCGKMKLIWMGIKSGYQRKGAGKKLLSWLIRKAKKLNLYSIEVETLPDEYNYKPYIQTRNFYYKNGFKRVEYKKARIKGWDDQIVLELKLR